MKAKIFVDKLVDIATNYKTIYVMGCFGAPMTAENKTRYTKNHEYNTQESRVAMINAASADTFGFDCVCLIKGILWGWNGDAKHTYGGARYAANGVPDIGADSMIEVCSGVSTDFSGIVPGAAVWCPGHIGVYIGGGLAVECTPRWENNVQITAVGNISKKAGYNTRTWTKWGLLPYIDYTTEPERTSDHDCVTSAGTGDNPSKWAETATEYCKRKGIFAGDGKGNYDWKKPITREQIAVVIYCTLEMLGLLESIPDKK